MIIDYRLDEIQARPIYKLSGWVYKAGNTNYGVEASRDFQLTEDDFSANGNTIRVEGGGAYPIGNAVCKTCSLTLKESANYSANDFSGACIELMIKAYNSTGSWVVTGDYYFVQTAKKTGGQIVLECADFMSKANVPYKKGRYLASTATLKNLFADVCSKCGVAVDADNTFPNSDFTYTLHAWQNFNSYTCRQMLGFIAMIAGGNALAIAGGTGFKINALNNADENSLYQWSQFTDDAESITVTGVEMTENTSLGWKPVEDPVTYKSSEYTSSYVLDLTEAENPLFKGRDQQAVDLIMTAVSGLTMRNFSGTHIGYPLAEYGDRAAITHRGGSLSTYITEYEWNISGPTTFACNVNGAAANNETYSAAGGAISSNQEVLDSITADKVSAWDAAAKDYIVEEGDANNWHYVKRNNGYAECEATMEISGKACTTAIGSWYRTAELKFGEYPFTFAKPPNVNMFFETGSGTGGLVWTAGTASDVTSNTVQPHQFYIIRMASSNAISGLVHIQVKGRFK